MPVMSGLSRDLDDTGVIKPRASRDQNIRLAELDRRGLVETFSDEFTEFSWHAEGAVSSTQPRKGTWRTNFGLAGVQELGSRTLPSNKEMEIYVDPGFRGTARNSLGLNPFSIVDGVLEIIADRAPDEIKSNIWNYPYTSGLITSRLSFSQLYGVFEIRARMPKGRGLWPCFWLLPTDRSWPPEIDILEILGHETTKLYSTMHTNETGSHVFSSVTAQVPDTSVDFHTYAVDWEKETITWYFDGTEIGRVATPADLHKPMYILANLAVGGTWPGSPDASTRFPAIFAIDWIRAYRRNLEP
jgi:beta-glucanase (GH16 family)